MDENQKTAKLNETRNQTQKEQDVSFDEFKNDYYDGEEPENDEINEDEFEDIKINPPEMPSFPYIIFFAAVIKDVFEIIYSILLFIPILNLATSALIFLIWIFNGILAIAIWMWIFGKSTFIRKQIIKKMVAKFIVPIFEFIPGLNAVPTASITVFLIYRSEKGIVKKIIDIIEKYEKYA